MFGVIKAGNVESMELACRNATEEPSEATRAGKHRGRTRAVGPGVVGVSNATGLREACIAVNRFLKSRFPDGTWTSIAVLYNPRMGLHRDIQNMPGHSNHALALGEYTGGRVWIEDDEGDSTAWLEDKKGGRELRGRWLDMHDKTSPSASMLAAITRSNPTRVACGLLLLMFHKPMLGRRSSTGRH